MQIDEKAFEKICGGVPNKSLSRKIIQAYEAAKSSEQAATDEKGRPLTYWGGMGKEQPDERTVFLEWLEGMLNSKVPARKIAGQAIRNDAMVMAFLDELVVLGRGAPRRESITSKKDVDTCED